MYIDFKPDGKCYYCGKEYAQYMKPVFENEHAVVYMAGYQKYYPGRCIVVLKSHKIEMFELTKDEISGFFDAVGIISKAISKVFKCDKLNYATCGDTNPHFHMHIVPKIENGYTWGKLFEMLPPENERILIDETGLDTMIDKLRKAIKQDM